MRTSLTLMALAAMACALPGPAAAQTTTAAADVKNLEGESLGVLTLTAAENGVRIEGSLAGLPAGEHGFHIHETGTCDAAAKFESAGGHFNPTGMEHGLENPAGPHAGDMPNITSITDGQTLIDIVNERVTLGDGGETDLLDDDGSAIVVHARPDDQETGPSGQSGARIACGVIEASD